MGRFIERSLHGVASQTFENWELIAVDDCGPQDGSIELLEAFAKRNPKKRVELIRHGYNQGVSAARNTALEQAKGEYIACLDPDDYWGSVYLEEMVKRLESEPVDVVHAKTHVVTASGRERQTTNGPSPQELNEFPRSLFVRNFIVPSCTLVRRSVIPNDRPFDESPELQHVEDWDFWLMLVFNQARFRFVDIPDLCYYRAHPGGGSRVSRETRHRRARALVRKHSTKAEFIDGRFEAHDREFRELTSSVSWRLGRALTWPLRKLTDMASSR